VYTPGGQVRALLPPVTSPGREPAMGPVPALGQHTAAILAELGLSELVLNELGPGELAEKPEEP